jgi:transcriptional regulator with XRE-family HTH domain
MAEIPPNASNAEYTSEVSRRIRAALGEKDWKQADLWRELVRVLGEENAPGKDSVSKWYRGQTLPRDVPVREALCQALGKEMSELFPKRDTSPPSLHVKDLPNGQAWLTIDQAVSWDVAYEIIKALKGAKG